MALLFSGRFLRNRNPRLNRVDFSLPVTLIAFDLSKTQANQVVHHGGLNIIHSTAGKLGSIQTSDQCLLAVAE